MSKDNVIQFPFGEIRNPIVDPGEPTEMEVASAILESALYTLIEHGYSPKNDPKMQEDFGLVLNILYAILYRANGKEHFLLPTLDEISEILREIKEELENDNP